jgi:predicted peptidase
MMMSWAAALLLSTMVAAPARAPIKRLEFRDPRFGTVRYALALPPRTDPPQPVTLVLALHSGGGTIPYYGGAFLDRLVAPALDGFNWILLAPDCPAASWDDPAAERATVALTQYVARRYRVDRSRVLITGFSLGGHGTWFLSSRHPELFTAAIPMAGWTDDESPPRLAAIPTFIIHGDHDQVVPFPPVFKLWERLRAAGRNVQLETVTGATHYDTPAYLGALRRAAEWVRAQWEERSSLRSAALAAR